MSGELDQVAKVVNKGLDAFRALGQEAPQQLKLAADAIKTQQDAIKGASDATSGWLPILQSLGSSWVARIAEGILLRDAIRFIITETKDLALALPQLALKGAGIADVEDNFKTLTTQAGRLGDVLLGQLRQGTHDTVTNFELMKLANKDLTAGLNLTDQQFGTLAKGAFSLAQATGGDVKTALDTMNDAMLTGRTRALALLTGKIDLESAEKKYAASIGVSRENLTDAGKLEAARAAILDSVTAATTRLGEQTDGLDERVAQASVSWENFTDDLGKAIARSTVLETGMVGVKKALEDTFGGSQENAIAAIAHAVDTAAIALVDLGQAGVTAGGFLVKEFYAVEKVFGEVRQVIDGVHLAFLLTQQTAATGILPGTADLAKWKALDDQIGALEVTMSRRGDSLQKMSTQQDAVDVSTDKLRSTLDALKTSMIAARDANDALGGSFNDAFVGPMKLAAGASTAFVGPLRDVADAHAKAGAAANAQGDALTKLSAKQEAAIAKLAAIDAKISESERDIRSLTDAQEKLILRYHALGLSNDEMALKLGVAASAVKIFLSDLADTEARMARNTTETGKFQQELGKMIFGFDQAGKSVQGFKGVFQTDFDLPLQGAITDLSTITKANELFAASLKRTRDALQNQLAGTIGLPNVQSQNKDLIDESKLDEALRKTQQFHTDVDGLGRAFSQLAQVSGGSFGGVVKDIGNIITSFDLAIKSANAFEKAETAAGKAVAVASGLAAVGGATGSGSTVGRTTGGALSGLELGSSIGSIVPGIGTAIGAAVGAIGGALTGLFRGLGESAEKEINPVRQAFIDAAGGLGELNKKAMDATGSLALVQNLLNAKNADQYKVAVDALNKALKDQADVVAADNSALGDLLKTGQSFGLVLPTALKDSIQKLVDLGKVSGDTASIFAALTTSTGVDFSTMSGIASKYGLDLKKLGPAFENARIGDTAKGIINDFDTLQRGLGDVDSALTVLHKPINDLVNDSITAGVALPSNFKPWVDQLFLTGQLVDDNGKALTDLSGVKYADPIVTDFQKLLDKIQALIDKISGNNGLTAALSNIPTGHADVIVDVNYKYNTGDQPDLAATGGLVTATGIQHFADGGFVMPAMPQYLERGGRVLPFLPRGTDTVPAMLTPGEVVLNKGQQAQVAAAMSGGGGVDLSGLKASVDALRNDLARDRRSFTRDLTRSLRDAGLLAS